MGKFASAVIADSRQKRHARELDADPSKWPVAPGVRIYMVDCEFCGSRMPLWAMTFHIRRHQRQVAMVTATEEE